MLRAARIAYGARRMDALPIDPHLPHLVDLLGQKRAVVLEAAPGAGKTTRVPRALLSAPWLGDQQVLVLEPRRLATRMAARRVAEELGESVGRRIGYQVRFEDVSSADTRVRFVTEGVLTRKLLGDPELRGVGAVLLDEFHERHLQGDLGLALLRRLQTTSRPDLRLCVMSATLETRPVAAYLADAPTLSVEGRRFDVALEHQTQPSQKPLHEQVAGAVARLVAGGLDGHVLVFLPGAGEIRRAMEACEPIARDADLQLLPLHGELSPDEQDRAVRPCTKRKVILATNVAETSLTIEGVVAVVDSGLARVAAHSPWSGLSTLRLQPVSKASATQRAGRAGRTQPGRCLRLYTQADFNQRPAHEEPEVRRLDLAQTVLELASSGIRIDALDWFEAPPRASIEAATGLLRQLGALEADGSITTLGRQMARLPVHPRLARVALEAETRGAGREGALLAAVLGERDVRDRRLFGGRTVDAATVESDAIDRLESMLEVMQRDLSPSAIRAASLDAGAVRAVDRARRQLERHVGRSKASMPWNKTEEALRLALLAGFPDRVAKRRSAGSRDLVFASGGAGQLSESSGVRHAQWVVALEAEERRAETGRSGGVQIRSCSAIEPEWLIELHDEQIEERTEAVWNASLERVDVLSRLTFGALVLDESPASSPDPALVAQRLFEEARSKGAAAFADPDRLAQAVARLSFVAKSFPEMGVREPTAEVQESVLRELCDGRRSFGELREAGFVEALVGASGGGHRLDQVAPETLTLPGGRRVKVHYEPDRPPWAESRLQDFFGLRAGPVLGGRVPLVLHLLAPNYRAVQVTTDLEGFWARHYPAIRKELMRRYPRHQWPEDPLTATPPAPRGR